MDRLLMKQIVEEQLALDYGCSVEELRSDKNIFQLMRHTQGERPVGDKDMAFKLAVYNEKLLVMAEKEILDWCREKLADKKAEWISEPGNLIRIHEKLTEAGQKLADVHHYYIPAAAGVKPDVNCRLEVYRGEEILRFREDDRFGEALLFDENMPDMLAVAAVEDDEILGLAGATKDTEYMWQLGVNVTEAGKGKGIGACVVAALKEEVLREGKVPFYATVESHIKSQKAAIRAGFEPVFYEMFSKLAIYKQKKIR
ncbi:MAG: GNAT family N-acetyltransferase [Lachnospiraceae bacterium]|nr:GNAT family N-acetyltransferase [Lachnospiraceae bacterium]